MTLVLALKPGVALAMLAALSTARPSTPSATTSAPTPATPTALAPGAALDAPSASAPLVASASAAPPVGPPPDDMALIAAGTFTMGEGKEAKSVTLTRAFYLDRNEVTVRAFQACVDKRMCSAADHVSVTAEADGTDAAAERAPRSESQPKREQPAQDTPRATESSSPPRERERRAMSDAQRKLLFRLAFDLGATKENVREHVLKALGVERLEWAEREMASGAIDKLQAEVAKRPRREEMNGGAHHGGP